jgi:uncharacterized delta-60 repeat protein
VTTQFYQGSRAYAFALLPNGKIIAVGYIGNVENEGPKIALARYNQNGTLDSTFGPCCAGYVVTQVGSSADSRATGVAILPDGKIVIAGHYRIGNQRNFVLVRYDSNGAKDLSFGVQGIVTTPLGTQSDARAETLAIQSDGKIIAAGSCQNATKDMVLVRYDANGTVDTTFGDNGVVITPNAGDDLIKKVKIQADGKIVAVGQIASPPTNYGDFILTRYESNGSLDNSFGTGGKVITDINGRDNAYDFVIQTDGKYVVAGEVNSNFALARYNPNGSLDSLFGTSGVVTTQMHTGGEATGVALQADGKIIVAGPALTSADVDFAVVRYQADGSLDTSFGTNGKVFTNLSWHDYVTGVAIQPNGRIVVAGYLISGCCGDLFGITRLVGDVVNRTRFDFDGDGKADQSVFRNGVWHLLRSQNGYTARQFGISTDKITPADFDGDGITDIAVYRDGFWHLMLTQGGYRGLPFGIAGDVPVPADYDGDGNADLAVYRNGTWHVQQSTLGYVSYQFGISNDRPVPADYDGDGKTDPAIYRDGVWHLLRSTSGYTSVQFGIASDIPVVGDFDGDATADQALYRSGVWHVLGSTQGYSSIQFGIASDVPVAADYDGDGKADLAVFRDGDWHILRSQQGFTTVQFGTAGDKPVPAAFVQ